MRLNQNEKEGVSIMKLKSLGCIALAIVFIASTFVGSASAWEKGNVKIVPTFKVEERWDSNIFMDSSDEKHDWITIITPGVASEFGFGQEGRHKAIVNYEVECGIFGEYDKNNYGNHDVFSGLELDFNDYTLDINNDFKITSSRAGTEFEHLTLRKEDMAQAVLGMDFNKFSADIGYSFFIVDYHSDTLKNINRHENSVWTTGYVQVQPKTKALLEYKYKNIQYPDGVGRNANAHAIMTGLEGQLTSKMTGIVKAGFKIKDYNSSDRDDFTNAVVHTFLNYDPLERVNIFLSYKREAFESTYPGSNYYTGDHLRTDVNYKFGGNWVANANAKYLHNGYPENAPTVNKKREDNIWGVGAGLDYVWKEWMTFGVGYEFDQRDSNISGKNYDRHIIMTDVRMIF